jgi:hypothetical protein
MASPRVSNPGKSARYYRAHPEARRKKSSYDTKFGKQPAQRKKRSELSTARRRAKAAGVDVRGKDVSHGRDGSLRLEATKSNRGRQGAGGRPRLR